MTRTYVALLRGINVGRAKRIAMADLRALVEDLGYSNVRTVLNSGNAVFNATRGTPEQAAARIERAIAKNLGIATKLTVLSSAELRDVVTGNPLVGRAPDPTRLLVAFLRRPADVTRLDSLTVQEWSPEILALGKRVAYLWCPAGVIASPLIEAVGRALGESSTTRNWSTVSKLYALAGVP